MGQRLYANDVQNTYDTETVNLKTTNIPDTTQAQHKHRNNSPQNNTTPRLIHAALGQVPNGQDKVARIGAVQAGRSCVERDHRGDAAQDASSLVRGQALHKLADGKCHKGEDQEEEHSRQGDRGAERGQEEKERNDHPGNQVDAERARELGRRRALISSQDAGTGPVNETKRNPEPAVHSERSSTKCVPGSKLPHAGKHLAEPTDAQGHAYNGVWHRDMARAGIVQRQDQSRRRESKQPEGRGVTKFTVVNRERALRLHSERGVDSLASGVADVVAVASAIGRPRSLLRVRSVGGVRHLS